MGRFARQQLEVDAVLETAGAFRSAADALLAAAVKATPGKTPRFSQLAPGYTLSAFSVELVLKALILVETGGIPHVHRLGDLYSKVGPESQGTIAARFVEECRRNPLLQQLKAQVELDGGMIPEDIASVLAELDDAFVSWRYVFEGDLPSVYGAQEAYAAILNRLDQLRG